MLGADVGVAELEGLAQGQLEDLLRPGVKGGEPGEGLVLAPMASSTFSRTTSKVTPRASRALAATPSPSRISPSRMCSVPMKAWLRSRASSWASTRTRRARSVKRSNNGRPSVSLIEVYRPNVRALGRAPRTTEQRRSSKVVA